MALYQFLEGVSIASYAEPCTSHRQNVCLSVRPSVIRWHRVKTTQARITKSSPMDRLAQGLVFGIKNHPEIRKGYPERGS